MEKSVKFCILYYLFLVVLDGDRWYMAIFNLWFAIHITMHPKTFILEFSLNIFTTEIIMIWRQTCKNWWNQTKFIRNISNVNPFASYRYWITFFSDINFNGRFDASNVKTTILETLTKKIFSLVLDLKWNHTYHPKYWK